jgi:hypothetical protein
MRVKVALATLACVLGLLGCGLSERLRNNCSMTFPERHLLTVSEPLKCCGDAKRYELAQVANDSAVDISLQAASATNCGAIPGLRLAVAITHCEVASGADCASVPDRTTPDKATGDACQAGFVPSGTTASVSGRNIRLAVTVTNDKDVPGKLNLDVTQGQTCPAPL